MSTRVKLGIGAAALVLLVFSAFALAQRRMAGASDELPVLSTLETFQLVDQRSHVVRPEDLRGSVWIADFIFTSCQAACPMLTSKMRGLQDHFAAQERARGHALDVRLVSFSVDPEVDTPEKLAAYATKWGADERRWSFLTGSLAEVNRAVTRGLKIPFEKGATETSAFDVMHGERLVIVDRRGRIRGYFDADLEGLAHLKAATDALLSEKDGGQESAGQ
jgi:protein SCO1/2